MASIEHNKEVRVASIERNKEVRVASIEHNKEVRVASIELRKEEGDLKRAEHGHAKKKKNSLSLPAVITGHTESNR